MRSTSYLVPTGVPGTRYLVRIPGTWSHQHRPRHPHRPHHPVIASYASSASAALTDSPYAYSSTWYQVQYMTRRLSPKRHRRDVAQRTAVASLFIGLGFDSQQRKNLTVRLLRLKGGEYIRGNQRCTTSGCGYRRMLIVVGLCWAGCPLGV